MPNLDFEAYCRLRTEEALNAKIPGFRTVTDCSHNFDLLSIGNDWTRSLLDGSFFVSPDCQCTVFARNFSRDTGSRPTAATRSTGRGLLILRSAILSGLVWPPFVF